MNMIESSPAQPSTTDWITAISAFGSLVVLFFYTYYTFKMQKSIAKQVEEQTRQTEELIHQRFLSILPSIFLTDFTKNSFKAHNIGYGLALNITFQAQHIIENPEGSKWKINYIIKDISQIPANELASVNYETYLAFISQDGRVDEDRSGEVPLSDLSLSHGFPIQITFQDIEGNNYEQEIKDEKDTKKHGFVKRIEGTQTSNKI